jgi:FimV-like protein
MAAPGVQSHASEVTVIPLTEPDAPPIGMDYAAVRSVDDRAALATPPASYGPTGRGDSLGSIAQILVPDPSYSINQRMLAVFERNPHAFGKSDGLPNMNLLRAGETLTAPDGAALARLDREAARQEVARQYQAWQKAIGKGAIQ